LICWPNEGKLTYYYLRKRLLSGYFLDNIPEGVGFPEDKLLNEHNDIDKELNEQLIIDEESYNKNEDEISELEDSIIRINTFQYEKYKTNNSQNQFRYSLNCNIIRFEDGSFMFLPKESSVISEFEETNATISVRRLKFKALSPGLQVFEINRDDINNMDLLPTSNVLIKESKQELQIWKEVLSELVNTFKTEGKLSNYLTDLKQKQGLNKANPNILNIKRWLNNDEMIAPSKINLKLIILAGKENGLIDCDVEQKVNELIKHYKNVNNAMISIGHQIKSAITKKLKDHQLKSKLIKVYINNVEVEVIGKTISDLENSDIEVEYHHTRKFLC
jgi:hypothetical protein